MKEKVDLIEVLTNGLEDTESLTTIVSNMRDEINRFYISVQSYAQKHYYSAEEVFYPLNATTLYEFNGLVDNLTRK